MIKNIPEFGFLPIIFGTKVRCNIPAVAVVGDRLHNKIHCFYLISYSVTRRIDFMTINK